MTLYTSIVTFKLLNSFISFHIFYVDSLGVPHRWSCCLWIKTVLCFLVQSGCLLLFSCLTALFKTCSTMLSRRCKSEYLCLAPNSIDQAFSFLPLCMLCKIFCMCLSGGYSLLFFPCWGFLSTRYTTIDAKWNSSGLWRIILVRNLDP